MHIHATSPTATPAPPVAKPIAATTPSAIARDNFLLLSIHLCTVEATSFTF